MTAGSVEDLVRPTNAIGGAIAQPGTDHWTAPTCVESDVRDAVHHLGVMKRIFAARPNGGPTSERRADHVGDSADIARLIEQLAASLGPLSSPLDVPGSSFGRTV